MGIPKKHLIGAGLFVVAFLASTLLFQPPLHPSDQEMIDYFNKHRTDFDRLVYMAEEDDSVRRIYPHSVMLNDFRMWPDNTQEGFSNERFNQYRSVFAQLSEYGINMLYHIGDQIQIPGSIASSELDNLESIVVVKGYVYSVKEPALLVSSLDEMGFDSEGTYYRRINDRWYLYHRWAISKPE